MADLDLTTDAAGVTAALVDIPSVSGTEGPITDAVQAALGRLRHLDVARDGNVVLARTDLGRPQRVVVAGHLDTVPIADNVPSTMDGDVLFGCGTCDMKSGDAVMLRLAATVTDPAYDLTFLFYDNEEVDAAKNGLRRIAATHRDWLDADLAILMEPTDGKIEAGCQGSLRAEITVGGRRAHSARSWHGENAIHRAAPVLQRLADYEERRVVIDGCGYREGLNAVYVSGGVAGNVIPDRCRVAVNHRFAPDRTEEQAAEHVREVFAGFDVEIVDSSPGALPGLTAPAAAAFVAAAGGEVSGKYGWTDVSRFAALGIPALNFGPGDPNLAHTREEHVSRSQVNECERVLAHYLTGEQ